LKLDSAATRAALPPLIDWPTGETDADGDEEVQLVVLIAVADFGGCGDADAVRLMRSAKDSGRRFTSGVLWETVEEDEEGEEGEEEEVDCVDDAEVDEVGDGLTGAFTLRPPWYPP
jgi:hypothetical protein